MRILFLILSLVGVTPVLLLVILTFFGFPQCSNITEKLLGSEPEVTNFYRINRAIAGKRISLDVVPRTLSGRLIPAAILSVAVILEIVGLVWYLFVATR